MDIRARRKFVSDMMAATAMAMGGGMLFGGMPMLGQQETTMHTIPEGGPPYLPIGGVQVGPDGENGNPPPGPIGAGMPAGGRGGAAGGRGGARTPRPKPAGISWISGTGTEKLVPSWDIKEHTQVTMDNIKRGIERQGGTMDSFLYMQVFFCLRNDDSTPKPTGSAAAAKYQEYYTALGQVYNTYWQGSKYGAPPRSCFALDWIPGNSLIEISAAYWIDPSVVPPPAPAGGGGGGRRGGGGAPPA